MKLLKKKIKKSAETENLNRTVREQKANIEELKRENADLLYTLDEYTKKENSILESIGYLEEKKREQTEALHAKYAAELERLKFFENKWQNFVRNSDDPSLKAGVAHTRDMFQKCRAEILSMTRKELRITKKLSPAEEDYESETARLSEIAVAPVGSEAETWQSMARKAYRAECKTASAPAIPAPAATYETVLKTREPSDKMPVSAPPSFESILKTHAPSDSRSVPDTMTEEENSEKPTLPRKMSDKEIMSLLEKMSL